MDNIFAYPRFLALLIKEFIQMKRDKVTLAMILGIPLMQVTVFGLAINSNPTHLPTVLLSGDQSYYTRAFIKGIENTDYFSFIGDTMNEKDADYLMATSKALFIFNIPTNFTRDLIAGRAPSILLTADATDPTAIGGAMAAAQQVSQQVFNRDKQGALHSLYPSVDPVNLIVHQKYNPEVITSYNIVPGLIGVILTMTMVIITALAITRERERGTMENLLATPARPLEIMLGKITPYIIVGYLQITVVMFAAYFLFQIPFRGSLVVLYLSAFVFIAANLTMGITFSTVAENQLQANQMSFFFFLPSILLSGFMFPFYGMPTWAQWVGTALPLTHFIRITRGIMLKGNGWDTVFVDIYPIVIFMVVLLLISMKRFKQTLD